MAGSGTPDLCFSLSVWAYLIRTTWRTGKQSPPDTFSRLPLRMIIPCFLKREPSALDISQGEQCTSRIASPHSHASLVLQLMPTIRKHERIKKIAIEEMVPLQRSQHFLNIKSCFYVCPSISSPSWKPLWTLKRKSKNPYHSFLQGWSGPCHLPSLSSHHFPDVTWRITNHTPSSVVLKL